MASLLRSRAGAVLGASRAWSSNLVRWSNFSSEATAEVKLPTSVFGVAGKYASALYVAATKAKSLEPVESELKQIVELSETNELFAGFLKDPSVAKELRVKAIEDIFSAAKFSPITKNFLAVLADQGRLSNFKKIVDSYEELLMAHRGEVKAIVTVALELEPEELDQVTTALLEHLEDGQTLKLDQKVDRSILGGLIVEIGDKYIDLSIRSKIRQYEALLSGSL